MRRLLLLLLLTGLLVLALAVPPVVADAEDPDTADDLLSFLGEAKLGYQKDASDYLRDAGRDRARCIEYSQKYDALRNGELTGNWQKHLFGVPPEYANILLHPSSQQRALSADTGWDHDFMKTNATAAAYWDQMKYYCGQAEDNYNAAYAKTDPDDYRMHARIFGEAAVLYDTIGDTDGARHVREAQQVAEEHAAAKSSGFSDCLIVTATFGSPMATEVQLVRDFRDNTIKQDYLGSRYVTALNAMYYSFSPFVARAIDENPSVKPSMRLVLAPLLGIVLLSQGLYSFLAFSPAIATVAFILFGGALVGLVYVMPVMLSALWVAGKKRWQVPAVSGLKPGIYLWTCLLAALVVGAAFRIDILTVLSSGLLFVCTALLTAAAVSLFLSCRFGFSPSGTEE